MTSDPIADEQRRPTGTLADLISDAESLGLQFDERLARDWHRRGLLGSPQRRALGRGHGSDPAVYSSQQRALFAAVARNRAAGARYNWLATIPVWAWMNYGDDWVTLDQSRRALKTAVGSNPRQSLAAAHRTTQQLLATMDFGHGSPKQRRQLQDELVHQLNMGRINRDRLRPKIVAVSQPMGLEVERGPSGASLTVDKLTYQLAMTMRAVAKMKLITDEQLLTARLQHQVSRAEYQRDRPLLQEQAGSLQRLFDEETRDQEASRSVSRLLLLLGMQLDREGAASDAS